MIEEFRGSLKLGYSPEPFDYTQGKLRSTSRRGKVDGTVVVDILNLGGSEGNLCIEILFYLW